MVGASTTEGAIAEATLRSFTAIIECESRHRFYVKSPHRKAQAKYKPTKTAHISNISGGHSLGFGKCRLSLGKLTAAIGSYNYLQ